MVSAAFGLYPVLLIIFSAKISCKATPAPTANIPLGEREGEIKGSTGTSHVTNLTRQHEGDMFIANGLSSCNMDTCVGLSSGTAGLTTANSRQAAISPKQPNSKRSEACECRCLPYLNTYREDLGICVDDIHECTLSPFISGSSSEKIPFVFLPLRGQIIYPSREISFPDVRTPVCAVTSSQFLTATGWSDLRNPIDTDFPFRLFRDEGRTFLQWHGEPELRYRMQGRLILVHLMCRDMALPTILNKTITAGSLKSPSIFTPCVAFRVSGSPVLYIHNVSEVLFQAETTSNLSSTVEGLSTREYIVIGICSLLLGLIYVASVFLYLHVKKRKIHSSEARSSSTEHNGEFPKNDQVTFGTPFSRAGSLYSAASIIDPRNSQRSRGSSLSRDDIGIVKNNPLLKHFPNISDHSGFTSDLSNSNSECEDVHAMAVDRGKNMQASVIIHPNGHKGDNERCLPSESHSPTQESERLPEANVSIVEDMSNDEKLDNMRAIVNGTVRKKLYFNPAYFEPHLLLSPPPAAIEFLTKIREVIAIAKYKMATKRYQPSLNVIPEEGNSNNCFIYNNSKSSQSRHTEKTNRADCTGCPGCSNHPCSANKCNNCGDKRNSIQKWLESVPINDEGSNTIRQEELLSMVLSSIEKEKSEQDRKSEKNEKLSLNKKLYVAPSTTPKIVSHSLKQPEAVDFDKNSFEMLSTPKPPSPVEIKTHYDQNGIYTFAETGNEIYNNPKFNHTDSPQLSQRSKTSSSNRNRSIRRRIEVLDQYANPGSDRNKYEMLKSIKHMPDMVYEALAKDYSMSNFNVNKQYSQPFNIPTPDYDGSIDKKMKDIYNNTQSSDPSVPTPDYSTLGRKSLRQYQPDSPVYRRRSPQYLIVDYETDSLERTTPHKKCTPTLVSPSNSSEASSQPSPSLSTALPLEEEAEIHHTVYDKVEGHRKDGDILVKKIPSVINEYEEVKLAMKQNTVTTPRIKYDTPFQGSMTIEVEHEPQSDLDLSTDSDQFEPDTLDRKPKKHSFCDVRPPNMWTSPLNNASSFVNANDCHVTYSSLENMNSLPDFSREHLNENLVLRSTSSFRNSPKNQNTLRGKQSIADAKNITTFGSLREIYQSKNFKQVDRPKLTNVDFNDQGKLLTLEVKHKRRQRKFIEDNSTRKLMPPDVIPPESNFYDIPKYPIKVDENNLKNLAGWNGDDFSGVIESEDKNSFQNTETMSNSSRSTEITGVSDTHRNSELGNSYSRCNVSGKQRTPKESKDYGNLRRDYSAIQKNNAKKEDCQDRLEPPSIETKSTIAEIPFPEMQKVCIEDLDKIEVLSTRSLSNRSVSNEKTVKTEIDFNPLNNNVPNIQNVYRVEIPSPTNGMQIAMGLKDRTKKSKDIKNAWKKFVNIATSKFYPPTMSGSNPRRLDEFEKKIKISDVVERDEGISSLIDHPNARSNSYRRSMETKHNIRFGITRSVPTCYDHRYGRNELDSGYMSADSGEVCNRRVYERYNFKCMTERDRIIRIDTIEDNSDSVENESENNYQQLGSTKCTAAATTTHQGNYADEFHKPIEVNVYSSDDEPYLSACASSESDDEGNTEDLCESGAESVETHSVLFKNIRKELSCNK